MQEHEIERLCRQRCAHCRRAYEMEQRKEHGHILRFRDDTKEWVHDFVRGTAFEHCFCGANDLRKQSGR